MFPLSRRRGGTPAAITDGVSRRLVPPGDAGALASGLEELLEDPPRLRALAEAGLQLTQNKFSLSLMVRQTAALYDVSGGPDAPRIRGPLPCSGCA
jgi:glycosyltransferase involved in cell wall biosynthesis